MISEERKKVLNDEGYDFICEEVHTRKSGRVENYIKIRHRLCGKEYSCRVSKFFSENQRCSCQRKLAYSRAANAEEYKKYIENIGYKNYILASEFISIKKPIDLKCTNCGNIISLKKAEIPIKCPYCDITSQKKGADFYNRYLNKIGITFLERNIGNLNNFIKVKFPCNHISWIDQTTFYSFYSGKRKSINCPYCGKFSKHITIEKVKKEIEEKTNYEYKLLSSEYKGTHSPLKVVHTICNNEYSVSRTNFINGERCPFCCSKCESNGENEVKNFIEKELKIETEKIKGTKNGYELDIYIPSLNLGFEYNGLYWHSNIKLKKDYHLKKSKYFKKKNINIIHIFEDDWLLDTDNTKNRIRDAINGSFSGELVCYNPLLLEKVISSPEIYYIHGKKRYNKRQSPDDLIIYGCGKLIE